VTRNPRKTKFKCQRNIKNKLPRFRPRNQRSQFESLRFSSSLPSFLCTSIRSRFISSRSNHAHSYRYSILHYLLLGDPPSINRSFTDASTDPPPKSRLRERGRGRRSFPASFSPADDYSGPPWEEIPWGPGGLRRPLNQRQRSRAERGGSSADRHEETAGLVERTRRGVSSTWINTEERAGASTFPRGAVFSRRGHASHVLQHVALSCRAKGFTRPGRPPWLRRCGLQPRPCGGTRDPAGSTDIPSPVTCLTSPHLLGALLSHPRSVRVPGRTRGTLFAPRCADGRISRLLAGELLPEEGIVLFFPSLFSSCSCFSPAGV